MNNQLKNQLAEAPPQPPPFPRPYLITGSPFPVSKQSSSFLESNHYESNANCEMCFDSFGNSLESSYQESSSIQESSEIAPSMFGQFPGQFPGFPGGFPGFPGGFQGGPGGFQGGPGGFQGGPGGFQGGPGGFQGGPDGFQGGPGRFPTDFTPGNMPDQRQRPPMTGYISPKTADFRNRMRSLWEQHVAWTRAVIVSIAEEIADEEEVTKRLLRNATDMARVFQTFYGDKNAARLQKLLTDHLVIAANLVKAAKAGNTEEAAKQERLWMENGDDIVNFLNSINPDYWQRNDLRKMIRNHLNLTKQLAVYRLTKDYANYVAQADKVEKQALQMADMIASGIEKQFPQAFM